VSGTIRGAAPSVRVSQIRLIGRRVSNSAVGMAGVEGPEAGGVESGGMTGPYA
jgi:hypothetical protein